MQRGATWCDGNHDCAKRTHFAERIFDGSRCRDVRKYAGTCRNVPESAIAPNVQNEPISRDASAAPDVVEGCEGANRPGCVDALREGVRAAGSARARATQFDDRARRVPADGAPVSSYLPDEVEQFDRSGAHPAHRANARVRSAWCSTCLGGLISPVPRSGWKTEGKTT